MEGNRIEQHAAQVREAIANGRKVDGSGPIGDTAALDAELAVTFGEMRACLRVLICGVLNGVITTDEALTIYRALGEVGSTANGGWAKDTDLALKVTVTSVIGQLIGR